MNICLKCHKNEYHGMQNIKCGHFICHKCLCDHLKLFTSSKICCPVENCAKFISDSVVRKCLSNDQLILYDQLSFSVNIVKCLIKDCTYFVSCAEEEAHFVCQYCGQPNCISCKRLHELDTHCKSLINYNSEAMEAEACEALQKRKRAEIIELQKKYALIPNPNSFECSICFAFILPREGVILRNCHHCFCRDCMKTSLNENKFISSMTCLNTNCGRFLESCEMTELISEEKLSRMMIKEASLRFFQCKYENCIHVWDCSVSKGKLKCPQCLKENCFECQDIHEGMTCEQFRATTSYTSLESISKIFNNKKVVKCYYCTQSLIQNGGCGSLSCTNCGNNTCVFTGKIAGRHDKNTCYCRGSETCSKIKMFCECTSVIPCHNKCYFGCYPE